MFEGKTRLSCDASGVQCIEHLETGWTGLHIIIDAGSLYQELETRAIREGWIARRVAHGVTEWLCPTHAPRVFELNGQLYEVTNAPSFDQWITVRPLAGGAAEQRTAVLVQRLVTEYKTRMEGQNNDPR